MDKKITQFHKIGRRDSSHTLETHSASAQKSTTGRPVANSDFRTRLGQVVKRYRLAAGMEQIGLAGLLGCSGNAIGGWELGRTAPSIDLIPKLCQVLHIPIHELMGMEAPRPTLPEKDMLTLSRYHTLSDQSQSIVTALMEQMIEEQNRLLKEQDRLLREQDRMEMEMLYRYHERIAAPDLLSSAAGPGAPAPDYCEVEPVYLRTSAPARKSDLLLKVNGDSMGEAYPDGSRVFVNTREETHIGEVGIFIVDGVFYIKERHEDCLFSINRAHEDIVFHENIDLRHVGRVLGVVDEADILSGEELDRVRMAFEIIEAEEE